jgi:hypothetical protein
LLRKTSAQLASQAYKGVFAAQKRSAYFALQKKKGERAFLLDFGHAKRKIARYITAGRFRLKFAQFLVSCGVLQVA